VIRAGNDKQRGIETISAGRGSALLQTGPVTTVLFVAGIIVRMFGRIHATGRGRFDAYN
jgi:hypothetical protein